MSADFGATGAAMLYGTGALVLFGVRSWQQKRATGAAGFNGFAASRGPAARLAGACFVVAVLAGLASPVLVRLHLLPLLWPGDSSTAGLLVGLGTAVTAAGFGLAVVAQSAMGASWRIGVDETERTDLVTQGIFTVVRNPIFTAMVIAQLGTALMAPTLLALAGVVLLVVGCQLQVRLVEEPYLLWVHQQRYAEYAARTGRFLPGLGRRLVGLTGFEPATP